MNLFISRLKRWLNTHPTQKQWVWFVGLWLGGLLAAVGLSYPLRYLIKLVG